MESIRDSVLRCIYDHADNDDKLISALNQIIAQQGRQAYPVILHVLTHLDLDAKKAEGCWQEIISHRRNLSEVLVRNISLRTAICDYFHSIDKSLKNPIVIEIHIFEATAKSSKFDSLTGLYSRGFFDESLVREIARAKRSSTDLSILFFDLDDFKNINDAYGHLAGDTVLKNVSQMVMEEIRSEDTAARYGGEEIILILPETGKAQALTSGERIRRKVEALELEHDGHPIRITLSGGLATCPIDAQTPVELVQRADEALYGAKKAGKNNIAFYSQDKRHFRRINYSSEIRVREIGFHDQKDVTAVSKNISIRGIRFKSNLPMESGTKVQLHIPIQGADLPVLIIGTVVRSEILDSGGYDISVSFLDVDKKRLDEFTRIFP